MTPPVEFRSCPPTETPAADLLAEMQAEMRALYAIEGPVIGVPLEPEELGPPGGAYLVGWVGDQVAAGGGVRLITSQVAEIKRMYVRPGFRVHGLGRALLGALEREAVRLGADTVRLDTGSKQPHAQSLYERSGYRPIGNWNDNAHAAYWGEKPLA
ncbi:MAG: GNAT family N-acetyltransferase [Acidimicrobiales bacterium]